MLSCPTQCKNRLLNLLSSFNALGLGTIWERDGVISILGHLHWTIRTRLLVIFNVAAITCECVSLVTGKLYSHEKLHVLSVKFNSTLLHSSYRFLSGRVCQALSRPCRDRSYASNSRTNLTPVRTPSLYKVSILVPFASY